MQVRIERGEEFFRSAWRWCARYGHCDAVGGSEYHRVYAEWQEAGRPASVCKFIKQRANISSGPVPNMEDQQ